MIPLRTMHRFTHTTSFDIESLLSIEGYPMLSGWSLWPLRHRGPAYLLPPR